MTTYSVHKVTLDNLVIGKTYLFLGELLKEVPSEDGIVTEVQLNCLELKLLKHELDSVVLVIISERCRGMTVTLSVWDVQKFLHAPSEKRHFIAPAR